MKIMYKDLSRKMKIHLDEMRISSKAFEEMSEEQQDNLKQKLLMNFGFNGV